MIGVAGEEADPEVQAAAAAASGMDACLVKPLSQRMLADALARVTGEAARGAVDQASRFAQASACSRRSLPQNSSPDGVTKLGAP